MASSIDSFVGLYLPSTPNTGLVSKILYVFFIEVLIRSCKIFLSSGALYLPVVSIKLANAVLASSIVLTISVEVFSSIPFLFNFLTNWSTVLPSVNLVKSPSNINSLISL